MTSVSSSTSSYYAYTPQKSNFSKLDADQNGKLTQDEFVSGRPSDVSEAKATSLYSSLDTEGTGALTEDQYAQGMESNRPGAGIESLLSGEAMAVLMLMSQQGGMTSENGASGDTTDDSGGVASITELYASMDADDDGSVTQAEFVSARPSEVSEEDATAFYSAMDTEGTGSITEEQLASGMRPPAGPPPGGLEAVNDLYASMDADSDGGVTLAEFLRARPDDMSEEDATALYSSIDTEGTGSITEQQLAESMQPPAGPPPGGMMQGAGGSASSDEIYDSLDTDEDGVVSEAEFMAGHPGAVSDEQAATAFASIDTAGTGSITREQFSTFMSDPAEPTTEETAAEVLGAASLSTDSSSGIDEILSLLDALSASASESEDA